MELLWLLKRCTESIMKGLIFRIMEIEKPHGPEKAEWQQTQKGQNLTMSVNICE